MVCLDCPVKVIASHEYRFGSETPRGPVDPLPSRQHVHYARRWLNLSQFATGYPSEDMLAVFVDTLFEFSGAGVLAGNHAVANVRPGVRNTIGGQRSCRRQSVAAIGDSCGLPVGFGPDGIVQLWITPEDLANAKFDKVRMTFEMT
jgi:hypothetical protein